MTHHIYTRRPRPYQDLDSTGYPSDGSYNAVQVRFYAIGIVLRIRSLRRSIQQWPFYALPKVLRVPRKFSAHAICPIWRAFNRSLDHPEHRILEFASQPIIGALSKFPDRVRFLGRVIPIS